MLQLMPGIIILVNLRKTISPKSKFSKISIVFMKNFVQCTMYALSFVRYQKPTALHEYYGHPWSFITSCKKLPLIMYELAEKYMKICKNDKSLKVLMILWRCNWIRCFSILTTHKDVFLRVRHLSCKKDSHV